MHDFESYFRSLGFGGYRTKGKVKFLTWCLTRISFYLILYRTRYFGLRIFEKATIFVEISVKINLIFWCVIILKKFTGLIMVKSERISGFELDQTESDCGQSSSALVPPKFTSIYFIQTQRRSNWYKHKNLTYTSFFRKKKAIFVLAIKNRVKFLIKNALFSLQDGHFRKFSPSFWLIFHNAAKNCGIYCSR